MSQIKHLLFDCDNTLVLTEFLTFDASCGLVNSLLEDFDIEDRYTDAELIRDFVGESFRGMMAGLEKKYNFVLTPEKHASYVRKEEQAVIALIRDHAPTCEGVYNIIKKLHQDKKYGIAVVSSSALNRIRAALEREDLDELIPHDRVYSAVTSLPVPSSKPNPAIYLHALKQIGVKPEECVTVEDSVSGAKAAFNAKIPCIGYVGSLPSKAIQTQVAKTLREVGCKTIMYNWSEYLGILEQIENA